VAAVALAVVAAAVVAGGADPSRRRGKEIIGGWI
jgi:hypothetical protein